MSQYQRWQDEKGSRAMPCLSINFGKMRMVRGLCHGRPVGGDWLGSEASPTSTLVKPAWDVENFYYYYYLATCVTTEASPTTTLVKPAWDVENYYYYYYLATCLTSESSPLTTLVKAAWAEVRNSAIEQKTVTLLWRSCQCEFVTKSFKK